MSAPIVKYFKNEDGSSFLEMEMHRREFPSKVSSDFVIKVNSLYLFDVFHSLIVIIEFLIQKISLKR